MCGLGEEDRAGLLNLFDAESVQTNLEKLNLYPLPFPPFLPLAVVQFDVLHALNQLYHLALLNGRLAETLDVQFPAVAHEEGNPCHIQRVACHKDAQHGHVVIGQYAEVDEEVDQREHNAYAVAQQEVLYPPVVADTLQYVARHAGIEELQGHGGELYEEIGNERDVDAGVHVEGNPRTDVVDAERGHEEEQLGHQYHRDDVHVAPVDALVHHGLREEGQDQLYEASHEHGKH